jgi:hypothetical protein
LLWTWISILHSSFKVWVGPGVEEVTTGVDVNVGIAVVTGVGAVVAAGVGAGWVQPLTNSTSTSMIPSPITPDMNFP